MAPISAISSTTNPKVSAGKSGAKDTESVRDEFSAIFEEFVPGFEADSGDSSIIDTSFTVAPLQVAQAPVVEHNGADDVASDEEAEVAAEPQREDNREQAASDSAAAPVVDKSGQDEQGRSDSEDSGSTPTEDVEPTNAETILASSDGKDASGETQDSAIVSKLSEQVAAGLDKVEGGVEAASSDATTTSQSQDNSSLVGSESDEVIEAPVAPKAAVHADVKAEKTSASVVNDTIVHNRQLNQAVREGSETQTEQIVQPKIENPVFGETRTEAEELARVMTRNSKDGAENTPMSTFEQPRAQNNTPLLEVLMNQVQRLTAQNFGAGNSNLDLNLGSKSSIQLGQGAAVTQVGANLLTKTDSDPRSAKIARQLPAAGVRTMERVQKALADAVAAQDGKTISLRLDPPELGQVKVDLSFRGGNLSARIVAESAGVTALLRERAHELQHTLRKLGLEANNVTVSVGVDSEQGEAKANFDGKREQGGQFRQSSFEQEIVEGLVAEGELQGGKVAIDHRVA